MATWSLISSVALLGLLGGSHCLAMCGTLCLAAQRQSPDGAQKGAFDQVIHFSGSAKPASAAVRSLFTTRWMAFQLGRLCSYAFLGALAASTVQLLALTASYASGLKMLWIVWHALVLALGLVMLLFARAPLFNTAWSGMGRSAVAQWLWQRWQRVRLTVRERKSSLLLGMAWGLMPCGFLYSALMMSSLTGQAWQGALAMLLFALGSGIWLWLAPAVRGLLMRLQGAWGQRLAGLLLVISALVALQLQNHAEGVLYC